MRHKVRAIAHKHGRGIPSQAGGCVLPHYHKLQRWQQGRPQHLRGSLGANHYVQHYKYRIAQPLWTQMQKNKPPGLRWCKNTQIQIQTVQCKAPKDIGHGFKQVSTLPICQAYVPQRLHNKAIHPPITKQDAQTLASHLDKPKTPLKQRLTPRQAHSHHLPATDVLSAITPHPRKTWTSQP